MRILLLCTSFNSLGQRLFIELVARGHDVTVELALDDQTMIEGVALARPDLVIAPFLKCAIPEAVFRHHTCLVVHPGPPGDRGPSSLDWAILAGVPEWGITILQAEAEMDGGPIWDSATFPMRPATKSSLYRHEVTDAAVAALLRCVERFGHVQPREAPPGRWRAAIRAGDRAIDWARDDTATVLRKIRSADGAPGLRDQLYGEVVFLSDAHLAAGIDGPAGAVIGRSGSAICRATVDGAVWIGHLRRRAGDPGIKLPATVALGARADYLPVLGGFDDIRYEERGDVGFLHFPFYNGAMSTDQCRRLRQAYRAATERPTRVVVLMGGEEYWSNGIHLNVIEAADNPADESWANINAINDLVRDIITTDSHWVVSAMRGSAGAGGVILALAADEVWARNGIVLNPHYRTMGNLYGSEYWTYLLPRRVGAAMASQLTTACLPVGIGEALRIGLVDACLEPRHFATDVTRRAVALAADPTLAERLLNKGRSRAARESIKSLKSYRREELQMMAANFFGADPEHHVARQNFVFKVRASHTPSHLARHRPCVRPAGDRVAVAAAPPAVTEPASPPARKVGKLLDMCAMVENGTIFPGT